MSAMMLILHIINFTGQYICKDEYMLYRHRTIGWSDVYFAGGGNHWVGIHLLAGAQNNRIQVRTDDLRFIYLLCTA